MSREPTFTKVPNYILESMMISDLTSRELRVLLAVLRKTAGYHETEARLSNAELSAATRLDKSDVGKTVNRLIEREVLREVESADFSHGRVLSLNLNTDEWRESPPAVGKTPLPTVGNLPTPTVGNLPTPTYYIKENIKKNNKESRRATENFSTKKPSYDKALFEAMLDRAD